MRKLWLSATYIVSQSMKVDLPKGVTSGLVEAAQVLRRVNGIAFTHFTAADVVRHPLVARIVEAYDAAGAALKKP